MMLRHLASVQYVVSASEEPSRCYYRVDHADFVLHCCDTSVVGSHHGETRACSAAVARLPTRRPRRPFHVHCHASPSGIAVMDAIMLRDASSLAEALRRHRPVQRPFVSHLHRAATAQFVGSIVTVAPSTYHQVHLNLEPDATTGAFVAGPPGILLHGATRGGVVTHLIPVRHSGPPIGRI